MQIPKVFISYSWSTEQRAIELTKLLAECNIDFVFDKYDLKEGQDKYAFMERCVTDKDIDKVLMLLDENYKTKSDGRNGGVGIETQIISPEIYSKAEQTKFIPIILDDELKSKPVYLSSRWHVDMSTDEKFYGSGLEQLIRCIFEEPKLKKPELSGKTPDFINGGQSSSYDLKSIINSKNITLYNCFVSGKFVISSLMGMKLESDSLSYARNVNMIEHCKVVTINLLGITSEEYLLLDGFEKMLNEEKDTDDFFDMIELLAKLSILLPQKLNGQLYMAFELGIRFGRIYKLLGRNRNDTSITFGDSMHFSLMEPIMELLFISEFFPSIHFEIKDILTDVTPKTEIKSFSKVFVKLDQQVGLYFKHHRS